MKLKIFEKGKEKFVEVGFWSFFKCNLLVNLALVGIVYGALLVLFIFAMMMVLMTGIK